MAGPSVDSKVIEFYNGGHILITGATGFMGKVVVEKFLRVCKGIDQLYLLIRVKKGKEPNARLKDIFDDPIFQVLKAEFPEYLKKVTVISGDCSSPKLGLSEADQIFLRDTLTHVFHGAATVRFDEKLRLAVSVNVQGVREMLTFCQSCKKLKSVLHTSTAYANCPLQDIKEQFYPAPMTGESALRMLECFNDEKLDIITPEIIKPWPNTYSFTKAIAEELVQSLGDGLPIAVFRPSMVVSTACDPIPGWIDNYYGPIGVIAGVGAGLMRTMYADGDRGADLVPVDMAVNALICAAWEVGTKHSQIQEQSNIHKEKREIPVYHFVTAKENPLVWRQFLDYTFAHGKQVPTIHGIWFYTLTLTSIWPLYCLMKVLYHLIPALIMDAGLLLSGNKAMMWKAYSKIHKFSNVISHFTTIQWNFGNKNTMTLWSTLSESDQKLFNFDMRSLDWNNYFNSTVHGVRLYLFKDSPNTLKAAKRKQFLFYLAHRFLQLVLLAAFTWTMYIVVAAFVSSKPEFFSELTASRWASRKTISVA